jgi:hypothetical protein
VRDLYTAYFLSGTRAAPVGGPVGAKPHLEAPGN